MLEIQRSGPEHERGGMAHRQALLQSGVVGLRLHQSLSLSFQLGFVLVLPRIQRAKSAP